MKAYLAGPMRGLPAFNFPLFHEAARNLRAFGHEIISPAEMDEEAGYDFSDATGFENLAEVYGFDIVQRLLHDIEAIAKCEGVICLPGWSRSSGARAEVAYAQAVGKKTFQYDLASVSLSEFKCGEPSIEWMR